MSLFQWDEKLSVNIPSIDRQHQKLISLVNQLHDAMKKGKGKEALNYILEELISYTDYHFKTEEKYFDQYGYAETERHKNEHNSFVKKVNEFNERFSQNNAIISLEVLTFLKNWVLQHIQKEDKKYSSFLIEKGVQ